MHTDPEVIWFLISVAIMVVVGVPRIRRTVWLPRELEFQEVPNAQLTPAQAGFWTPRASLIGGDTGTAASGGDAGSTRKNVSRHPLYAACCLRAFPASPRDGRSRPRGLN